MSAWSLFGIAWLVMIVIMVCMWLVQRKTDDAGIVDVAWTFGIGGLAIFFALCADGSPWRRLLVASLAVIWSLRLGIYILHRVLTLPEDGRYTRLKSQWGQAAQIKMFGFYQIQAFAAALFAVPVLLASRSSAPLGVGDWVGILIWCTSVIGESVADRQLARFRRAADARGKVCQQGLWKYSRHPNYFFEWLHWWAYVCFSLTAPWGWLSLFAPLTMYFLITRVSGIPPTEAQALQSRGDAYRTYQRTTSPFFPWPPRTETPPV